MNFTKTGQQRLTNGDIDARYTMRIYLIRDGRPQYWEFHCIYCGTKVCELNGQATYGIDVTPAAAEPSNRTRCTGKFCRMWYEFQLS